MNRVTRNFEQALIDDAFKASDAECAAMAALLLREDGLFVGSSSALNCVGAVRAARALGGAAWGGTVVTLLCDSGARHLSRFASKEELRKLGIAPKHDAKINDLLPKP